jgi:F-type H+-transporting ATPase subunit b
MFAAEEVGGIAALGIDPLAILAQAVTFLVLFYIVKRFALEKIVKTLEERRKTIDKGVKLGFEMEAEKARLEGTIQKALQDARNESDKIIAGAQTEARQLLKDAEEKAAHKTNELIAEAHAKIALDVEKARRQLQADTLALVAEATEAIIHEKLDTKKDAGLIKRWLGGVRG